MKIITIYDDKFCSHTTGIYVDKALKNFPVESKHYSPLQITKDNKLIYDEYNTLEDADLYICIDDDLGYPGVPERIKDKAVYWVIDTHRMAHLAPNNVFNLNRWDKISSFHKYNIYSAQKDFAYKYDYEWLPLACDPTLVKERKQKVFDWCFIGRMTTPQRRFYTNGLKRTYNNAFVGTCSLDEMYNIYSQSDIIINISCANDLNQRYFEAMSSGAIFITNEINNGEYDLFDYFPLYYFNTEELKKQVKFALDNREKRLSMAKECSEYILKYHNYSNRVKTILERHL